MTRRRAALAAAVVAVAMALAGAGISHIGQTKATQAADIGGHLRQTDNVQAGSEMA
jgi:hypothetical protein